MLVLPNAFNFPEWKSSNNPSSWRSMCRTSGTSEIKEWCLSERVSKPRFDCESDFIGKSTCGGCGKCDWWVWAVGCKKPTQTQQKLSERKKEKKVKTKKNGAK